MPLSPGTRLGPYEVVAQIGAGGMGEVYRATDTDLKRQVALKVLPASVAADPDRLARFQREAETLAALNHPNIAHIHGIEKSDGTVAVVMELVEGPTLAERITNGPIPLDEVLSIARQIAEALEAAHEQGIIHRDLKPANIKVRDDGTMKLLDFGLAKTMEPSVPRADVSQSPTISMHATQAGVILGTAAYMSPEQTRGKGVDKRTDIWAFGCVLYEMLTGRSAFPGSTVSDTIAAILEREPVWTALPAQTPGSIQRLLRRCLNKDPKRRLRDVGDARIELESTVTTTDSSALPGKVDGNASPVKRRSAAIVVATVLIVAGSVFAVAVGVSWLWPGPLDSSAYRFIPLAAESADETSPSWSPDGKSVVYVAEVEGLRQLFVRTLDASVSTQLTKSSTDSLSPFWSPDGTQVYFVSQNTFEGQLWSTGATGGEPQLVMQGVGAAAVAPDGKTFASLRGSGGNRSLWVGTTANSQHYRTRPFPETFTRSGSVEFSRDGKKIGVLVERQEGTSFKSELWVIPYPSGTPRRVLERARDVTGGRITWAPDNRHIVLDAVFLDRTGSHLYLVDTERRTVAPVTSGTVDEESPSLSPAGNRIAFAAAATILI